MPAPENATIYGIQIRESANDGSDFSNAATDYRKLFLGEDGLLHVKDSAGTVTSPYTAGGVSSGTSNPGSPADGDLFFRTDLRLLITYYSTGTKWLTVNQYVAPLMIQAAVVPISANNSFYTPLPNSTYDVWVDTVYCQTQVNTTNNGSQYWNCAVNRFASGTGLGSFNTSADTANTMTAHTVSVGALTGTTDRFISIDCTKTSTPGNLYVLGVAYYRLKIT